MQDKKMHEQFKVFGIGRMATILGLPDVTVRSWLRPERGVPRDRHAQIARAMRGEVERMRMACEEFEREAEIATRIENTDCSGNWLMREKNRASGG